MVREALAVLSLVLVVPTGASAVCTCMLRRTEPASVTQQQGLTSDPSYAPAAGVFVVRDGTRTVLTMETVYDGPPEEVSMLIPVRTPIERDDVHTVPGHLFRNLDRRTAPKVRHVWPACRRRRRPVSMAARASSDVASPFAESAPTREQIEEEYDIDIVDEWEVQEYDITLLGAEQSAGLFRYLRDQDLALPSGGQEVLQAYIQNDFRFVLAKADPERAHRLGDEMMLSPIQIEYQSDELQVPVRLGTLNSPGEQELLLYVLSTEGRFELANRPNVEAPTDLRLRADAAGSVAELYESLTDEVFRRTPGAAVTEFAHTLGSRIGRYHVQQFGIPSDREARRRGTRERWTLTRIRHRYGKDLDSDLTLRPASSPLRMERRWPHPELRTWAPRGESGFHVQFVVRHAGCPSQARQRSMARQFATAESMWESDGDLWPGEVLLDPVSSLGIEPGSEAPEGWPPPPAFTPAENIKPDEPVVAMQPQAQPQAQPMNLPPVPMQSTTTEEDDEGLFCGASGADGSSAFALFALLLLGLRRRR